MIRCHIDDIVLSIKMNRAFTISELFDIIKRDYYGPIDRYVCILGDLVAYRWLSWVVPEGCAHDFHFINVDKHKTIKNLDAIHKKDMMLSGISDGGSSDKLSISSLLSSIVKIRKEKIMLPPKFRDKKMEFK